MKNIILLTILIITSISFGQNCKYKTNEIDDFTKKSILETKSEWLCDNVSYSFKKIDGLRFLNIDIGSSKVFSISDGAKFIILTDKDQTIELVFQKYQISRSKSEALVSQYISQTINITEDVLERLKNEAIKKVRIYTTDGYIDHEVKEKRAIKFKELLKCID